jgi:hypothetical protein
VALTVVTLRPNTTMQLGSGTVVGAATAHAALADSVDTSYVQMTTRSRLDSQVVRVGFPTPSIPSGAKVYSVGLRRRVQTVSAGTDQPVCHHWFRSTTGTITVAGQAQQVLKSFFNSTTPTSSGGATWVEEALGTYTTGPGGAAWDPATNLAGFAYEIGRGDDATSALRVSAVYLDVTYQATAAVTVTGPTGTVTSTRPTVTWTYASPEAQPQQAYRVAVYTAAQVAAGGFIPFSTGSVQQSGWLLGESLQWTLPSDITDGTYHAYVQASAKWAGVGEFPTAVAATSWTRSAAAASPPPAAVLSSAAFDSVNNRVALTFAPGGSTPATTAFTVETSRDGGVSWQPIPSLTYVPANGMTPVIRYDNVAPLNVTSRWRVIAYAGSPLVAAATPSGVLSSTPADSRHWLKDPSNPLLNTVLPVAAPKAGEGIKVVKRRMQGTFQLLGGPGSTVLPVVVSGPSYGDEYELELIFRSDDPVDYWSAVDQLDRDGSVLLLQKPDGGQLWVVPGPGATGRDTEETYNARPGNPRRVQWRRRKMTLTQVAAPDYY